MPAGYAGFEGQREAARASGRVRGIDAADTGRAPKAARTGGPPAFQLPGIRRAPPADTLVPSSPKIPLRLVAGCPPVQPLVVSK